MSRPTAAGPAPGAVVLPDPGRLVFVGGLHRSGTTPLARVLAGHPQVSGFAGTGVKEDEGQHLQDVYPAARRRGGAGRFALDPRSHLTDASPLATPENGRRLLEQWAPHWDLTRPLLVEKSPPNLVSTRFLQRLFPGARFVVVVRHPVVVALSTLKWSGPATGMEALLRHWVVAHDTFVADAAHLERLRVLRYEDLVSKPEETLAGLAAFLGVGGAIPTTGLEPRRSDGYVHRWRELQEARGTIARARLDRLRRRYAGEVARFGYDFDDLDLVHGPFPVGRRTAPGDLRG